MTTRSLLMACIMAAHEELASFARKSFSADGRGVVRIGFPIVPAGVTAVGVADLVYHTLEEIRTLTRGMSGTEHEDADILIRMAETYDPETQAVVLAAIDRQPPISIRLRLDRPVIVDEAEGIH